MVHIIHHTQSGIHYFEHHFRLPAVKLLPGDYLATHDHKLLVTVLGSCVAACLRDPETGVSGMNHFMLPQSAMTSPAEALSTRFGVHAMELLIADMQKQGARRNRLQAKVFGAGKVLEGMNTVNVGEMNADFVRHYLEIEKIPIIASDLLGTSARKVYFFTGSGRVMIRRLQTAKMTKLIMREKEYYEHIQEDSTHAGSCDLFNEQSIKRSRPS